MVLNSYRLDTIPVVDTPCETPDCERMASYYFDTGAYGQPCCWEHLSVNGRLLTAPDTPRPVWTERGADTTRAIYVANHPTGPNWAERITGGHPTLRFVDIHYDHQPGALEVTIQGDGEHPVLAATTVPLRECRGELPHIGELTLGEWLTETTPYTRFADSIASACHAARAQTKPNTTI